jgi:hypothetical protein
MQALGVRIVVTDFGTLGNVHIYDAETGRELTGVMDVYIHVPVGGPTTATMTVLVDSLEVSAEAEIASIDIRSHDEVSAELGIRAD